MRCRRKDLNLIFVISFAVLLMACRSREPIVSGLLPPETTVTAVSEHEEQWTKWQNGPHAQTYALEKGPNTYCAKCHAPANWDPAATIDNPPNCVSCKFPFEAAPRIAAGNPLVDENEWENIGCNVCHREQDGLIQPEVAWFNVATGYYEVVPNTTMLCEKCHLDNDTLAHKRELAGGVHAEFQCTDCHDAHDTQADCVECHQEELTDPLVDHQMYSDSHRGLVCIACHDASGLQVGPAENQDVWVTFRTTELLGRVNSEPYQSHVVQREVACHRCHFADNPWELDEIHQGEIDEE